LSVISLDHVQLAMPAGREPEARVFYQGILGIPEVPKPGPDFRPARKAHPALVVSDFNLLKTRLLNAGHRFRPDDDPFGNRIELMEVKSDPRG
jgi:hypothetical protein